LGMDNHFSIFAAKALHLTKGRKGDGPPLEFAKVLAAAGIIQLATIYGESDVSAPIFLGGNQPECWKPH
jgi:hypothetical protein